MAAILPWLVPAAISLFGAKKQSDSAKSAQGAATAAGEREIEFARESRDLARSDAAPYKAAGGKALDALMSMTGIGGPVSGATASGSQGSVDTTGSTLAGSPWEGSGYTLSSRNGQYVATDAQGGEQVWDGSAWGPAPSAGRGGAANPWRTRGRAGGGALYNVNELGPENVFDGGSYTRSSMPKTIPPSNTGYVGRAYGGALQPGWSGDRGQMGVVNPRQGIPNVMGPEQYPSGDPKTGGDYYPNRPAKDGPGGSTIDNETGRPIENPGGMEGGYNFMTDPGYEFRLEEGQRAIERSAAARGGLLSGGTGRALQRYGQNFASNEYTNVYNRIANIAGLGQVASQQSGNAALQGGMQMGNAAAGIGNVQASGYMARGGAWANAADSINNNVPWESIFNKSGAPGATNWDNYEYGGEGYY